MPLVLFCLAMARLRLEGIRESVHAEDLAGSPSAVSYRPYVGYEEPLSFSAVQILKVISQSLYVFTIRFQLYVKQVC